MKSIVYTFAKSDHWGPQVQILAWPLTEKLSKWRDSDLYELLDPAGIGVTGNKVDRALLQKIQRTVAGVLALGGYSIGNWHVMEGEAGLETTGGGKSFYKTIYLNQPCQSTPTLG